jgi:hypothetical protein
MVSQGLLRYVSSKLGRGRHGSLCHVIALKRTPADDAVGIVEVEEAVSSMEVPVKRIEERSMTLFSGLDVKLEVRCQKAFKLAHTQVKSVSS